MAAERGTGSRRSWDQQPYDEGLVLTSITDETTHRSPGPSTPADDFRYLPDALLDEPSPLDVEHDETRRFILTNHQVSRCVPLLDPPVAHVVGNRYHVGMGYTTLRLVEKRAVAYQGRLLRLWPRHLGSGPFTLVLPPNDRGNLQLGAGSITWHAVGSAINLSDRMRDPVVLVQVVDECNWH